MAQPLGLPLAELVTALPTVFLPTAGTDEEAEPRICGVWPKSYAKPRVGDTVKEQGQANPGQTSCRWKKITGNSLPIPTWLSCPSVSLPQPSSCPSAPRAATASSDNLQLRKFGISLSGNQKPQAWGPVQMPRGGSPCPLTPAGVQQHYDCGTSHRRSCSASVAPSRHNRPCPGRCHQHRKK